MKVSTCTLIVQLILNDSPLQVLTKEEEDAHYNVVLKGGVEGFAYGAAVALPGSFYLNRTWKVSCPFLPLSTYKLDSRIVGSIIALSHSP